MAPGTFAGNGLLSFPEASSYAYDYMLSQMATDNAAKQLSSSWNRKILEHRAVVSAIRRPRAIVF